ncbi:hypothetical protein CDIK_4303, partial [Cucumispora dikerogammari]
ICFSKSTSSIQIKSGQSTVSFNSYAKHYMVLEMFIEYNLIEIDFIIKFFLGTQKYKYSQISVFIKETLDLIYLNMKEQFSENPRVSKSCIEKEKQENISKTFKTNIQKEADEVGLSNNVVCLSSSVESLYKKINSNLETLKKQFEKNAFEVFFMYYIIQLKNLPKSKILVLKITKDIADLIFESTAFHRPSVLTIKEYIDHECKEIVKNINILLETKYIEHQKRIRNKELLEDNEQGYRLELENFKQSQKNEKYKLDDRCTELYIEQLQDILKKALKTLIKTFTTEGELKNYLKELEKDIMKSTGLEYDQEEAEWANSGITEEIPFNLFNILIKFVVEEFVILLFDPMLSSGYSLRDLKRDFVLEKKQFVASNINRYIDFIHFFQWIFSSIISTTEICYN